MIDGDIKFIKEKKKLRQTHTIEPSVESILYNPGSRAVRPWRFQGGMGVQREVVRTGAERAQWAQQARRSVGNRKE